MSIASAAPGRSIRAEVRDDQALQQIASQPTHDGRAGQSMKAVAANAGRLQFTRQQ